VAGEEISWGQRLLGFTPPEVFLQENYQQEFEIHNILRSISDSKWARSKHLANLIAISYGVASLVALIPGVPRFIGPHFSLIPWLAFVVVMNKEYPFDRTGEFTELVLGTVFVADIAMRRYGVNRYLGARTAIIALSGVLVVGITIPPTLEKLVYGKDTRRVSQAREELELLKSDMFQEDIFQPHAYWKIDDNGRKKRKKRFHKRVYTAVKQHYIHFDTSSSFLGHELSPGESPDGEGRNDNRGYLIDPWGQSYWIVHEWRGKSTAVVVLYSMGPNRRRDITTRKLKQQFGKTGTVVAGDDVGVYLKYQL
jgi:hypothetical protein